MNEIIATPRSDPSVWRGDDMRRRTDWVHVLTPSELAQLDHAIAHAEARGVALSALGRQDFPLESLGDRLDALRGEIEGGRGFQVLRGVPVERYSLEQARILAWGMARHLGDPEPQDARGSVMHDITDTGRKVEGSDSTRGFETNDELTFHNDGGDAFMLLCLRAAHTGGTSKLASVGALFNEVLDRRPELARVLQEPFHFDARAQALSGTPRVQTVPIMTCHAGFLSGLYKRRYIELGQRFEEVPPLTAEQTDALDMVDAICNDPDFHLSFEMRPGDVQIGNNYAVLHSRTRYQDHDAPALRRHLLRIWMTLPNGRPLPPAFARTREFGPAYARRMTPEPAL